MQIKVVKGEKVDVILNNYFKELKVRNQTNFDTSDELEVQASVTLHKLKEWLINKNYLDIDYLKKMVTNKKETMNQSNISESNKKLIEKFVTNPDNLWHFIDFVLHETIVI